MENQEPKGDLEVVIVAAVAAFLNGRAFRVRRIDVAESSFNLWSHIGRLKIQASHRLHKRN
jgi:hypothetical protein